MTSRPISPRSSSAPGGTGGAEGDAHELDAGQRLIGAHGHQLDGVGPHGRIALVFQHFHAVDHGTQRPDKVVTDAADQQGGKFNLIHDELHAAHLVSKWLIRSARS